MQKAQAEFAQGAMKNKTVQNAEAAECWSNRRSAKRLLDMSSYTISTLF
jgi:hypothetical protein